MEKERKKCSLIKHSTIDAIGYCQECKIFFCNKCQNLHSQLFENHNIYLNNDTNEIFIYICKEENHNNKFEFFCKTHNKLCCLACICKIKKKEYGQHLNCDVCLIKDIKNEKKNKLIENINNLEQLSNKLIRNDIKILFEKISNNKESLKTNIQKIFTKIRNELEQREDELLLEVDKKFNDTFLKEEIMKESEKFPKKITNLLEKSKKLEKSWNNNNLNSLINDCIYIENNLENIIKINEILQNFNLNKNIEINFEPDDKNINQFLEIIKSFGKIIIRKNNFRFNNCPNNINKDKMYIVKGEKGNIITKLGEDKWVGVSCEPKLKEQKEYKWKIKY